MENSTNLSFLLVIVWEKNYVNFGFPNFFKFVPSMVSEIISRGAPLLRFMTPASDQNFPRYFQISLRNGHSSFPQLAGRNIKPAGVFLPSEGIILLKAFWGSVLQKYRWDGAQMGFIQRIPQNNTSFLVQ